MHAMEGLRTIYVVLHERASFRPLDKENAAPEGFGVLAPFQFLVVEELKRRRPILESFNWIFRLLVTF